MKDLFVAYFHELIDGIPLYVYEALLFVFCLTGVLVFTFNGISKGWKRVVKVLLFEYLILFFCSTVLFRIPKSVRGYELTPFWSYTAISNGVERMIPETVMNVVVFIPVGLMMGLAFIGANWRKIVMAGVGMSLSIELMQLLFRKGCCETDDVIHNTIGCVIGYGIYIMARYLKNRELVIIR